MYESIKPLTCDRKQFENHVTCNHKGAKLHFPNTCHVPYLPHTQVKIQLGMFVDSHSSALFYLADVYLGGF